jgi:hypothetical protein
MDKIHPFDKPSEAWADAVKDEKIMGTVIEVTITNHVGNLVRYDYYNDGSRGLLDVPYRPRYKHAKFRLPSGKPKCERFGNDLTDELILQVLSKKYSNFKFINNSNK